MPIRENPLARGRSADVYQWDDTHVLKLFHPWFEPGEIQYEQAIARTVHAGGVKAPAVGEIVQVLGRNGLVYELYVAARDCTIPGDLGGSACRRESAWRVFLRCDSDECCGREWSQQPNNICHPLRLRRARTKGPEYSRRAMETCWARIIATKTAERNRHNSGGPHDIRTCGYKWERCIGSTILLADEAGYTRPVLPTRVGVSRVRVPSDRGIEHSSLCGASRE